MVRIKSLYKGLGILVFVLSLMACSGNSPAVQNAQEYLKAIKEGNTLEAEKYVCPSSSTTEQLASWTEEIDPSSITEYACKLSDGAVECTLSLGTGGKAVVTFIMEEDKVCGVESVLLMEP